MKLSAKRRALLDELSTLVKAVHGPQAMALPYNLGVQILGTGVHACSSWDHLGHEVERYRSKVDDAATNGDKRVAEIHETAEAFGEEDPLDADGGECELIAAGASLCAEAVEALMEVTK